VTDQDDLEIYAPEEDSVDVLSDANYRFRD